MPYFDYVGKKVYFQEIGKGKPCVFLHGNTASSRMFEPLLELYADSFKVILIDFMGNGRSERVERFPDEMWIDQGHQVVELCKNLGIEKVNLVGTSGGAYAAVNAILEAPEFFDKAVADSFDGNRLPEGFADSVIEERKRAQGDRGAREFYQWCQGDDWERVVDLDTEALVNYERKNIRLFHRPVERVEIPLMITVSLEDGMISSDIKSECERIHSINPEICFKAFDRGGHPLILTRAEEMADLIKKFIL